ARSADNGEPPHRDTITEGDAVPGKSLDLAEIIGDEVAPDADVALVAQGHMPADEGNPFGAPEADASPAAPQRLTKRVQQHRDNSAGGHCWIERVFGIALDPANHEDNQFPHAVCLPPPERHNHVVLIVLC